MPALSSSVSNATDFEQLTFALEAAGIGSWNLDVVNQQVWLDERCRALYGFGRDEVVAWGQLLTCVHPDDRAGVTLIRQRALNPQSDGRYDVRFRVIGEKDGQLRWLRCRGQAYFTPEGAACRLAGVVQDVSGRVDLLATEVNQRQLLNSLNESHVGLAIVDGPELTYRTANAFYCQLVDRTPEQLLGRPMMTVFPELVGQGFDERIRSVLDTGVPHLAQALPARLLRQGQLQTIYVDVAYHPCYEAGCITGVLIIANDVTHQVNARQVMAQNEAWLRTVVENAPFPFGVFVGEELEVKLANQALIDVWNKGADVVGRQYGQIVPELNQTVGARLRQVFQTGKPYNASSQEVNVLTDEQMHTYYFDVSFNPLLDIDGRVYGVTSASINVTEAVNNRRALEQREAQLRSVIESAPAGIGLFVGRELIVEMPNQTFIDIVGKGPDIVGKPLREVMPELVTENQPFLRILDDVYTSGQMFQSYGAPVSIVQNGVMAHNYYNITYTPLRNEQGEVYAILDIAFDVTGEVNARQQAEEARQKLLQSESQQRFLLTLTDQLRPLSDASAMQYQAAKLLGDYLGASRVGFAEDLKDSEHVRVTQDYCNDVPSLAGDYTYHDYGLDLLNAFRQGRTTVLADSANDAGLNEQEKQAYAQLSLGAAVNIPLLSDGQLIMVLFVHYRQAHCWSDDELRLLEQVADRTWLAIERVQAEAALRQSEERYRQLSADLDTQVNRRTRELAISVDKLRRSNDNLQQFAYVASHDLQEPLRKIQQFGNLLQVRQQDKGVDTESAMYIERMQSAASRMSTLIKDLLTYARIDTHREPNQPVPLNEVIDDVQSTLELALAETEATIDISALPTVPGDFSQLSQLFQNLLGNALKFRRPDVIPHIQIRAERVDARQLPTSVRPTHPADHYCRIDVIDNGIGFDAKYADRIFQVFQRLHNKSQYAGTGIGLAVCQKVAANHGGGIVARSQPNEGTTFSVYLPAD
ncbi:PAS domain-containing protein [Spirosoma oryzae]|uniref:histidine kinase n=1 Tax=Spirosoma oryzae TaxID=1469603 RepID=A0A2T0RLE7_9BACT|nr:PAS domain-containing protein [Spirosoma oryzae]PRY21933.1 PAS domain-containing protein [Spirosoma oryzae]